MIRQTPIEVWLTTDGKQSFHVPIKTTADPTGTPPAFGITAADDEDGPSAWTNGQWTGAWLNGETTSVTPLIGSSASGATLTLTDDGDYWVWAKVTYGVEVWVEPVFPIKVPS